MQPQRIGFITLITLLAVAATPFIPSFLTLSLTSPAWAQTPDSLKAKADQLLKQYFKQYQTRHFQAALQSCQLTLPIYRQIGDKVGEGSTLNNIGFVHQKLGQYPQALKFLVWEQTKVTLRLVISYFNWIWMHSRLGTTAAQRADLTSEPWTWRNIATYSTLC